MRGVAAVIAAVAVPAGVSVVVEEELGFGSSSEGLCRVAVVGCGFVMVVWLKHKYGGNCNDFVTFC